MEFHPFALGYLVIILVLGIAIQRNALNINRIQTIGFWMVTISGSLLLLAAIVALFPLLSF